jgi:hypothetical protein
MVIRTLLGALTLAAITAAQPRTAEEDIQQELQRILIHVRGADDKAVERFLAKDSEDAAERTAALELLKGIRNRLRPTSDAPMSELSAPLVIVRAVTTVAPGRASACAYLVRIGSLSMQRLAAYEIVAAKAKESWRLVGVKVAGRCEFTTDPLIGPPLVL